MTQHINLDRRFWPLEPDSENDPENIRVSVAFGLEQDLSWDDLLSKRRVVILAEPGTGKTEELRATAERLRSEGKPAFFCRIEFLQNMNIEDTFDIGTQSEFRDWLQGDQEGYFFLDSVDEALLTSRSGFEIALRRFSSGLGQSMDRAKVIVSCRVSNWRATADLSMFLRYLPVPEKTNVVGTEAVTETLSQTNYKKVARNRVTVEKGEKKEHLVFQLMPLNERQIKVFADEKHVKNAGNFFHALQNSDAMVFAERPQDLFELIEFWNSKGRLGRHAEMLEFNVQIKLAEHDPEKSQQRPLSTEDAHSGAERLAAATTLQKKNPIILPDRPIDMELRTASVDPKKVLPDWPADKIQILLDRAVFDEAVYGTIRFHHRLVREFLTAKWLHHLLENGAARRSIEGLLFANEYGRDIVIPSMRPIASWLALWDERIRDRLMQVAPEVLLQNGDPSSLPLDFRRTLLISLAEMYAERHHSGISVDMVMVRRFADPQLSSTIKHLLGKFSHDEDIRTLLLELIWQGQIIDCADIALSFATDKSLRPSIRAIAVRAVAASGKKEHHRQLLEELLDEEPGLDPILGNEICEAFFSETMTNEQLLKVLENTDTPERHSQPPLERTLEEIAQRPLPHKTTEELIRGIHLLLSQEPFIDRPHCQISQRYAWLLPAALRLANQFIIKRDGLSFDPVILDLFLFFLTGRHYIDEFDSKHEEFLVSAKAWPEFTFRLFWYAVAVGRSREGDDSKQPTAWWQMRWDTGGIWTPHPGDLEPLFHIMSTSHVNDKLIALTAIFQIYIDTGRQKQLRERMKSGTKGVSELEACLYDLLHPRLPDEMKKYKRQEREANQRQKAREKKQLENRRSWQEGLKKTAGEIRNIGDPEKSEIWSRTVYLYDRMREKKDRSDSRYGYSNWQDLIEEFGNEVAKNFRDGCVAYWRGYNPFTYPNYQIDNSIPWPRIIGLTGLAMEATDDPHWTRGLTHEEAMNAARYSVCEMNGFPFWFKQLLDSFPEQTDDIISGELDWEIHQSPSDSHSIRVLSAIKYSGDPTIRGRYNNIVLDLLEKKEPDNIFALEESLSVILENPSSPLSDQLSLLARTRFRASSDSKRKYIWLRALLSINGRLGTELIKEWLAEIPTIPEQKQMMINLCSALRDHGGSRFGHTIRDYETIEVLNDLLPLIYQYVRVDEDVHHAGVYSPSQRDNASETRSRLVGIIYNTPGRASYDALMHLSGSVGNAYSRDRMDYLAKERAALDAELEPWDEYQIAEFAALAERQPRNESELFQLALARLDDLKIDIEDGDESEAALFLNLSETQVRTAFANRLRKSSRSRYTIGSEEELADATRTDIRLNCPQVSAPVPIELKIADKWSYTQLCERLENQLIGQYMLVSQCGIFLVVHNGRKRSWSNSKTNQQLTFSELVSALRKVTHELAGKYANVSALEVTGIDFTARNVRT